MGWSRPDGEAARAIALVIVALLLPLVTTLWLRDRWRRFWDQPDTNTDSP